MRNTWYIKWIDEIISILEEMRSTTSIGSERRERAEREMIDIYLGNDTPQREHLTSVSKLRSGRWIRQGEQ